MLTYFLALMLHINNIDYSFEVDSLNNYQKNSYAFAGVANSLILILKAAKSKVINGLNQLKMA